MTPLNHGCGQMRTIHVVLGAQLADAVARLHAEGIWHLDLKPSNLLIAADGGLLCFAAVAGGGVHGTADAAGGGGGAAPLWRRLRLLLCDFGGSSCPALGCGARLGTPRYWAPEQCFHKLDLDVSAHAISESPVSEEASRQLPQAPPLAYWGGEKCADPPPVMECDVSDRCVAPSHTLTADLLN